MNVRRRNAPIARAASLAPNWWLAVRTDGSRELLHRDRWGVHSEAEYYDKESGEPEGWYRPAAHTSTPIAALVKLAAKADRSLRPIVRRNPATRRGPVPGGAPYRFVNVLVRWRDWPFRGSPTIETNRGASEPIAQEIVALGQAALDRAWNAGNTADDSIKMAVRAMRQHPATKRVVTFVGNPRRRNGPVSAQRKAALAAIWKATPREYRSTSGSVRKVLVLRSVGTTVVPLEHLTDAEIARMLPRARNPSMARVPSWAALWTSKRGAARRAQLARGLANRMRREGERTGWIVDRRGDIVAGAIRGGHFGGHRPAETHVEMYDPKGHGDEHIYVRNPNRGRRNPRKPAPVSPRQVALLPEALDDPRQLTLISEEKRRQALAMEAARTRKQVRPLFENRRRRNLSSAAHEDAADAFRQSVARHVKAASKARGTTRRWHLGMAAIARAHEHAHLGSAIGHGTKSTARLGQSATSLIDLAVGTLPGRRRRANPHHAVVLSPAEFRAWASERDRGGPVHRHAIMRAAALAKKCGCQTLITGPRGQVLGYIRP